MQNSEQQKLFERVIVLNDDGITYSRNATIDEIEIWRREGLVKYCEQQIIIVCKWPSLISSDYLKALVKNIKLKADEYESANDYFSEQTECALTSS
jgi:hypothetical protein